MDFFSQIMDNSVLIVVFWGWLISCVLKGLLECIKQRRLDITRFMGPGGMPSSHSTVVTCLTTSVGITNGFDTSLFAMCCVLSFVVMYDASGIRRAAGQQAKMINMIIDAWDESDPIEKQIKLKELLGHTPLEVIAGAALGVIISVVCYHYVF